MSSDTAAGVLDSIDGALRDFQTSTDAMRWVPEEKREEAEAGEPGIQALARALAEASRPLTEFCDAMIRGMSAWTASPQFRALAELAADPRVQAAIGEAKRRRAAGESRSCHCLCGRAHPGEVNVCEASEPVTARRYDSPTLGPVDVALCAPCAVAQGVAVPATGRAGA